MAPQLQSSVDADEWIPGTSPGMTMGAEFAYHASGRWHGFRLRPASQRRDDVLYGASREPRKRRRHADAGRHPRQASAHENSRPGACEQSVHSAFLLQRVAVGSGFPRKGTSKSSRRDDVLQGALQAGNDQTGGAAGWAVRSEGKMRTLASAEQINTRAATSRQPTGSPRTRALE